MLCTTVPTLTARSIKEATSREFFSSTNESEKREREFYARKLKHHEDIHPVRMDWRRERRRKHDWSICQCFWMSSSPPRLRFQGSIFFRLASLAILSGGNSVCLQFIIVGCLFLFRLSGRGWSNGILHDSFQISNHTLVVDSKTCQREISILPQTAAENEEMPLVSSHKIEHERRKKCTMRDAPNNFSCVFNLSWLKNSSSYFGAIRGCVTRELGRCNFLRTDCWRAIESEIV